MIRVDIQILAHVVLILEHGSDGIAQIFDESTFDDLLFYN